MTKINFLWMAALLFLVIGNAHAQSKKKLAKRLDAVEAKSAELEKQNKELAEQNATLKKLLSTQEAELNKLKQFFFEMQFQIESLNKVPTPLVPPTPPIDVAKNVTSISFTEETFDFGTLKEGDKVEHIFVFKNTGTRPLTIETARGSCGCTVPEWPKEAIAPGATGQLKVVFNSRGKRGQQKKSVTITANTDPADTVVFITGMVEGKNK